MESFLRSILKRYFEGYVEGLDRTIDCSRFPVNIQGLKIKEQRFRQELDGSAFEFIEGTIGCVQLNMSWAGSLEVLVSDVRMNFNFYPVTAMKNMLMCSAEEAQEEKSDGEQQSSADQEDDEENLVPMDVLQQLNAATMPPQPPPPPFKSPRFCMLHGSSDKRDKGDLHSYECEGCRTVLQTTYVQSRFCPFCSNKENRCLCCGAPATSKDEGERRNDADAVAVQAAAAVHPSSLRNDADAVAVQAAAAVHPSSLRNNADAVAVQAAAAVHPSSLGNNADAVAVHRTTALHPSSLPAYRQAPSAGRPGLVPIAGPSQARCAAAPVFCPKHGSSELRPKGVPQEHVCQSCSARLHSSYTKLALCPPCSARSGRCLICCDAEASGRELPQQPPFLGNRVLQEACPDDAARVQREERLSAYLQKDASRTRISPAASAASLWNELHQTTDDWNHEGWLPPPPPIVQQPPPPLTVPHLQQQAIVNGSDDPQLKLQARRKAGGDHQQVPSECSGIDVELDQRPPSPPRPIEPRQAGGDGCVGPRDIQEGAAPQEVSLPSPRQHERQWTSRPPSPPRKHRAYRV